MMMKKHVEFGLREMNVLKIPDGCGPTVANHAKVSFFLIKILRQSKRCSEAFL